MSQQQQHKPGQPVVGFNHNINYKGRIFHVQTEDSGAQHGHVITHIFMGGNILASTKSSYAELLPLIDPGDIFSTVRKLMEDQHKAMMKGLGQGAHDADIARRTNAVYEPGVLANGDRAPGLLVGGDKPSSLPPKTNAAPVASKPPPAPTPTPARPAAMASSLTSRRPLATAPPPAPPVMVPDAISMTKPPALRSTTSAPGVRNLDDIILAYLAADDVARRSPG